MLPPFDDFGNLPAGIHSCTIEELVSRFGTGSEERETEINELLNFIDAAKKAGVQRLMVNGSFVTGKPEPNDIDLIVEVSATHDFAADVSMAAYNILSKQRVRRRFGFDLLLAREGSAEGRRWAEFFQQVRLAPGRRKGILRLWL